ncbi:MAG: hypothetical protein DRO12_02905 [Thermoprotei archaeon]|mgnify:CR=1 FL=1|nr:MAG: hypothetical protein DRO12_02905 [Thermoprotei archaeon]
MNRVVAIIRVSAEACVRCKGRKNLCGLHTCPLVARFRSTLRAVTSIRPDLTVDGSTPPTVIVGERGYPRVPVLYGVPPGITGFKAKEYDDPEQWWGRKKLDEILELRSYMVAGIMMTNVRDVHKLYELEISLAGVSEKPVDSEMKLLKLPIPKLSFNPLHKPTPPKAPANNIKVVSNPKVPRHIDKIIWDDVKAQQAMVELYLKGVSIYNIQRALSLGLLGMKFSKRLVPLRWSITAVDTTISRYLLSRLRNADAVSETLLYSAEYLGNRFWILIEPGKHQIHWIEIWYPATPYTSTAQHPVVVYNHEKVSGRPSFLDGGYEAAKLAVLEHLYRIKRQARIMIIREITPRYYAAVGNWHIRETVRRALRTSPIKLRETREAVEIIKRNSPVASETLEDYLRRERRVRRLDIYLRR